MPAAAAVPRGLLAAELCHRYRCGLLAWRCSLSSLAAMGRHAKVLGDALFGAPQCIQDTDPSGAGTALQTGRDAVAGPGWCRHWLGKGWADGGGGRRFMVHGRNVPFRINIRKVEFNEALLQKF